LPKEEINEIIMKIELKKFQKLIENRIQRKNTLLKADIKRMFPQTYHGAKPLTDEFKPDTNEHNKSKNTPLHMTLPSSTYLKPTNAFSIKSQFAKSKISKI
jgi:hypothetical protein